MMENRGVNYNDFGDNNQNLNFQLHQHVNQPYHMGMQNFHHNRFKSQAANVLYVADLPDETCEEDLMGLFKDYHYKVSRVTNGLNKTFALVHFETMEMAEKARNDLNGVKIAAKYASLKIAKPIRLCRWETKTSINERKDDDYKKNLLVKNINKDIGAHYFWNLFKIHGDVRSCKLSVDYAGNSKGFGYVTYYNVSDAEKARQALNGQDVAGKNLSIEFLQPGLKKKLKKNNVYVKHFPKENFFEEDLKKIFSAFGEVSSVLVPKDKENTSLNKGFGFVCFKNVEHAEKAQMELSGKKLFEGLPSFYVSFAMKKEERLEHLQKKKEELMRSSCRTTLFCKIKEGVNIDNESDFNTEIMKYFYLHFGNNFYPRSLKSRIETRTAFITMNTINEVESFIGFFNDYSKAQPVTLYFNPYRSKIDRINQANKMKKKYNDFNAHQVEEIPRHFQKNYNDFSGGFNNNMMPNNNMTNTHPFMQPGKNMNDELMNNFKNMMMQNMQNMQNMPSQEHFSMMQNMGMIPPNNISPMMNQPHTDIKDGMHNMNLNNEGNEEDLKGAILDNIYHYVEKIHAEEAPKITGMIAELSLSELQDLVRDTNKLESIVKSAYNQLNN